jgi:hypothetical protein
MSVIGGRAVLNVGDRKPVEQVVVADRSTAAKCRSRDFGLVLHAVHVGIAAAHNGRHGIADKIRVPANRRQHIECRLVQDLAGGSVRGLDHGGLASHGDRLLHRPYFKLDVEREELLCADSHIRPLESLEAWNGDPDGVHARIDRGKGVLTHIVRRCFSNSSAALHRERHRRARNDTLSV